MARNNLINLIRNEGVVGYYFLFFQPFHTGIGIEVILIYAYIHLV